MKPPIYLAKGSMTTKSPFSIKKHHLISIIWAIMHTAILTFIIYKITGSHLEFMWFAIILLYISFYLIATSILLDVIVEREFKQHLK